MDSPLDFLADASTLHKHTRGLFRPTQWDEFAKFKKERTMCCLPKFDTFPQEAVFWFQYLSKGAANVIFQVTSEKSSDSAFCFVSASYEDKTKLFESQATRVFDSVLRVSRGRSKHLTCDQIMDGFYNDVRPLFEPGQIQVLVEKYDQTTIRHVQVAVDNPWDLTRFLMSQTVVLLYPGVLDHLASLTEPGTLEKHVENSSPERHMGILLPDMSPVPRVSITLEIKPKWLRSSPNAPSTAVRCRTCAMQVLTPKDRPKYICPMYLVSGQEDDISIWVEKMVERELDGHLEHLHSEESRKLFTTAVADRVVKYLTAGDGRTLLVHLRWLDSVLDSDGILAYEDHPMKELYQRNLRLAMTLRDCSLFIKIPYREAPITAKLGDLDFKSAEKFEDWKEKEEILLAKDLYHVDTGNIPPCYLYRPSINLVTLEPPGLSIDSSGPFVSD